MPFAELLQSQGNALGEKPFLRIGDSWFSYASLWERVDFAARSLRELGLEPGHRLAIILENCEESVVMWLAANAVGVVDVPINVEAKGESLGYLMCDADPQAIVVGPGRVAEVISVAGPGLNWVITAGPTESDSPKVRVNRISYRELVGAGETAPPVTEWPLSQDLATIMYTSGTSGRSKGVMLPQGYYQAFARLVADVYEFEASDRLYCAQPLYHMDPRAAVCSAAAAGASVCIGDRFSPSRFWSEVARVGANKFQYIGTMLWLLHKQESASSDAQQVSIGVGSATPAEIHAEFEDRFGLRLVEGYGMTEAIVLAINAAHDRRIGSAGRPVDLVELRIVDEADNVVPANRTGEIVFRPRIPNAVSLGYWRQPEATAAAWRNLWFHTGDLGRLDEDGYLHYVGRLKDSIRRRGENVSAWEVEQALTRHPSVLEAAVIGVPSPVGEEDVAALIVVRTKESVVPAELRDYVAENLPRFAVPRYIEVVDELPKTPSERIEKSAVRDRGVSPRAWDAEAQA